jgi:hypothetical protein
MEPTQQLVDELYRERVRRARVMSPEAKLFAGARIFERVCRVMKDGIRDQYPEADENKVQEILRQRLRLARRLEQPA